MGDAGTGGGSEGGKVAGPDWLSPQDRDWVQKHRYFLEAIWKRLVQDGDWPDPVEVQRELRFEDSSRKVTEALTTMPRFLVRQETLPPRIALTIFGLGCFEAGRELLGTYVEVSRLALERFDSPQLPNRLSRRAMVASLSLSKDEAGRLSRVLIADAPFLGTGSSSVEDWDREVDPRAEEFEGIDGVDELLLHLAAQRGVIPSWAAPVGEATALGQPAAASDQRGGHSGGSEPRIMLAAAVVSALAAVAAALIPVISSPSIASFAVVGFCAGLAVGSLFLRRTPVRAAGLTLLLIAAGGVFGGLLEPQPAESPHGYFVAIPEADVLSSIIRPRVGEAAVGALVAGDKVNVRCITDSVGHRWAELEDGAWVEARYLRAEVGGGIAPVCGSH